MDRLYGTRTCWASKLGEFMAFGDDALTVEPRGRRAAIGDQMGPRTPGLASSTGRGPPTVRPRSGVGGRQLRVPVGGQGIEQLHRRRSADGLDVGG